MAPDLHSPRADRAAELRDALRRERSACVALCWVALIQLIAILLLGAAVAWDMARAGGCP